MQTKQNRNRMLIGLWLAAALLSGTWWSLRPMPVAASAQACTNNPVVTTTADSGAGSLRQAIADACSGSTITFNLPANSTITLASGELVIDKQLTIQGPGAKLLTISGNKASRIFTVISNVTTTINRLTMSGGNGQGTTANEKGGAIANFGNLTLRAVHLTSSTAGMFGGGIYTEGPLTIADSAITNNTANPDTPIGTIVGETGGGIHVENTTLTLTNTTISGNRSVAGFGDSSGGVWSYGTTTITACTITDNESYGPDSSSGVSAWVGTVTIRDSIVAGNRNNAQVPDVLHNAGAFVSGGHNLIGNPVYYDAASFTQVGDQVGTADAPLDPKLGPLANNGGPTPTHALLPGSPAINAGDNCVVQTPGCSPTPLTTDQRGTGFSRQVGGTVDIGAFEYRCFANPVVTTTADNDLGSLRQAIVDACSGSTITFNLPANSTITLTSGELVINKHLTIQGPGAQLLTISGNNQSRVFHIVEDLLNVTLSRLTIANGHHRTPDVLINGLFVGAERAYGGGIYNQSSGTVNVTDCVLTNNWAQGGNATGVNSQNVAAGFGLGGAICHRSSIGTLNVTGCLLTNNQATTGTASGGQQNFAFPSRGGAIFTDLEAALTITRSTISGNSSTQGAGIYTNGALTVTDTTISNNRGGDWGGGANVNTFATAALTNTTISGNTVGDGGLGAGLAAAAGQGGLVVLTNCTITDNHGGEYSLGGGLYGTFNPFTNLKNTIIAGNTATEGPDVYRFAHTLGNNLIGNGDSIQVRPAGGGFPYSSGVVNGVNGDQVGTAVAPLDPKLAPLANNGGPTLTHALLPDSPAINAGDNSVTGPPLNLTTDQRGASFSRQFGSAVDIGAFEYRCIANPVVTTTADSGAGSLRQAIDDACVGSTITFNLPANSKITLTSGELLIDKDLTIQGPGANLLAISGNQNSRVFHISSGNVLLNGLTVTGGNVVSDAFSDTGGGIFNNGTLTLSSMTIADNAAGSGGGGIHNRNVLTITNSLISGNSAFNSGGAGRGGGILNGGTLTVIRSTISHNSTGGQGGGISNAAILILRETTVSLNSAVGGGGGIYARSGTLSATNSTVTGNSAPVGGGIQNESILELTNCTIVGNHASIGGNNMGGGIATIGTETLKNTLVVGNFRDTATSPISDDIRNLNDEPIETAFNNLIGDAATSGGITNGTNGNLVGNNGTGTRDLNTILSATLANNGGPTQTHRLLLGSPALNAGTSTDAPATDQRGVARPQNGAVDIGAVEASFALAATGGTPQSAVIGNPFAAALHATLTENGLPFANVSLTFTAPGSGASATFPNGATVNTNAQGQASASAVANLVPGGYAVQAAATGLPSVSFALTNACPTLTLTTPQLSATAGAPFNATLMANPAGGNYQFSSANLPAWLTLTNNGGLNGNPPAVGSYTFNVAVAGFGVCSQTLPVTLTVVCPAITLAPASLPNGVQGTAYNKTLSATPGGTTYSYAVTTNALPPGLTLASNGVLSGIPTAGGNYAFSVTVTGWAGNGGGCTRTYNYNLLITGTCAPVTLNPASLPNGTLGAVYQQSLSATGGNAPYQFSVTQGALPPGLTLEANTGLLSGAPQTGGAYSFRVTATGQGGCSGSRNYLIVVGCSTLTFSPNALPAGIRGAAYSQQLAVNQASNVQLSLLLGSLPPGFNLSSSGLLSGLTNQTGSYNFTVKALAGTCQGTQAYTLVINGSNHAALALSGDYDGDGQTDPALWSAKDGTWQIVRSGDGQSVTQRWGTAGDVSLLGDYDGDGKSDLAVFRPADATFYVKRSSDGGTFVKAWGLSTDVSVPGDYDADGKTDIAVWRGAEGNWYVLRSSDGQTEVQAWGASYAPYLDVPVAGDYDGDGKSDLAVFRRGNGTWFIKRSRDGQFTQKAWGLGTDAPVAADYDGDGQTDLAVWRAGVWFIWTSASGNARQEHWGSSAAPYYDQAAPGDYDGDGKADLAVWRAGEQAWYVRGSADGNLKRQAQGRAGDAPVGNVPKP